MELSHLQSETNTATVIQPLNGGRENQTLSLFPSASED